MKKILNDETMKELTNETDEEYNKKVKFKKMKEYRFIQVHYIDARSKDEAIEIFRRDYEEVYSPYDWIVEEVEE